MNQKLKGCFVLGSPRSGSSMLVGLISGDLFFNGDNLLKKDELSPKGYLESLDIIYLHDDIIHQSLNEHEFPKELPYHACWALSIEKPLEIKINSIQKSKIKEYKSKKLFCYKDPRLSYTLPVWNVKSSEYAKMVIFREPEKSIESIIVAAKHLHNIDLSSSQAEKIWFSMYSSIIRNLKGYSNVIYIHFDDVFTQDGINKIKKVVGTSLDICFPDRRISKSTGSSFLVSKQTKELYLNLLELSKK